MLLTFAETLYRKERDVNETDCPLMDAAFLKLNVSAVLFNGFSGSLENRTNEILNPYWEVLAYLWQKLENKSSSGFWKGCSRGLAFSEMVLLFFFSLVLSVDSIIV